MSIANDRGPWAEGTRVIILRPAPESWQAAPAGHPPYPRIGEVYCVGPLWLDSSAVIGGPSQAGPWQELAGTYLSKHETNMFWPCAWMAPLGDPDESEPEVTDDEIRHLIAIFDRQPIPEGVRAW